MIGAQRVLFAAGIVVGMVLAPVLYFGARALLGLVKRLVDRFHRKRLQDEYKRGYEAGWTDGNNGLGYNRPRDVAPLRHGEQKTWSRF